MLFFESLKISHSYHTYHMVVVDIYTSNWGIYTFYILTRCLKVTIWLQPPSPLPPIPHPHPFINLIILS